MCHKMCHQMPATGPATPRTPLGKCGGANANTPVPRQGFKLCKRHKRCLRRPPPLPQKLLRLLRLPHLLPCARHTYSSGPTKLSTALSSAGSIRLRGGDDDGISSSRSGSARYPGLPLRRRIIFCPACSKPAGPNAKAGAKADGSTRVTGCCGLGARLRPPPRQSPSLGFPTLPPLPPPPPLSPPHYRVTTSCGNLDNFTRRGCRL